MKSQAQILFENKFIAANKWCGMDGVYEIAYAEKLGGESDEFVLYLVNENTPTGGFKCVRSGDHQAISEEEAEAEWCRRTGKTPDDFRARTWGRPNAP